MNSCPICHKETPVRFKKVNGFDVWKCLGCKLMWVPNVDHSILEAFYSKEYFKSSDGTMGYHDYMEDEEIIRINARYILSNIPAINHKTPKLFDVGCAYGFLLDESRKKGWDPYGIEVNREAVEYARNQLRLNVNQGTITETNFEPATFDAVIIIGSIEHFRDPIEVIKKSHQLLKPGGYLAITTIDTQGPVRLYDLKPPEHLYYFSAKNLALLLESHQFKVLKSLPYWCHYHLNEALCRAFRLVFRSDTRIEKFLGSIPILKAAFKVPTNEMFMLARKV